MSGISNVNLSGRISFYNTWFRPRKILIQWLQVFRGFLLVFYKFCKRVFGNSILRIVKEYHLCGVWVKRGIQRKYNLEGDFYLGILLISALPCSEIWESNRLLEIQFLSRYTLSVFLFHHYWDIIVFVNFEDEKFWIFIDKLFATVLMIVVFLEYLTNSLLSLMNLV